MKLKRLLSPLLTLLLVLLLIPRAQAEEVATSAKACIIIDEASGRVLLSHNAETPLPMASTTKVMTALLAIERGNLGDPVTCSRNAFGVPGTSIYLSQGETLSLRDMLYGLMLASGNDAAVAIAEHIGGTAEEFCRMMTARAAELGCQNTVFLTPHGLPCDGHYTTARELAAIAAAALENETFAEIAGTYKKVISTEDGSISRLLVNHNRMLRSYDGAIGVKTGYTSGAGRCLVSAARRDGVTLIAVTLDDHRDWADHTAMLDAGFAAYSERILCGAGELTYTLPLEGAEENSLTVSNGDSAAVVLPRGAELRQVVELPRFVFAPVRSGQTLGAVHYYVGEREVASVPLFAQQSAEEKQSGISGFFASLGSRISALLGCDE